jgi:hypothetical protein
MEEVSMINKKVFFLGLALLLCTILTVGCTSHERWTPKYENLDIVNAFVVADDWSGSYIFPDRGSNHGKNDNYAGPNGTYDITTAKGTLIYDCANTWCGVDCPQIADVPGGFHYAVLCMKADTAGSDPYMKIGNIGMALSAWGITLTTEYRVFIIDIAAKAVTNWPNPMWSFNPGVGTGKIYVDYIKFANRK